MKLLLASIVCKIYLCNRPSYLIRNGQTTAKISRESNLSLSKIEEKKTSLQLKFSGKSDLHLNKI